ncbi:aldehyde dehydrogenase family protein [Nocardioides sp. NPDC087217]|uniref:aldehyde dehydrogenase family protein n=1 Tax=Nocardioides sp. NPDC087217 TaxID=3364335 RepID=UPI0037F1902E
MTIDDTTSRAPGQVPKPEPIDITATVERIRSLFGTGRTRPIAWRLEQIDGLERLVTEREQEIAEAIGADLGRNAFDSWFGEIVGLKGEIAETRRHLRRWMRPKRHHVPLMQRPGAAWVQYEPLGVVLVIGPWNYPVLLTLSPLLAAVSAGNAVVVKPSEMAPATSALLSRLLPEYLDPEAVKVVEGDGAVTQELLARGFDHAFFTGGTAIGRKIMAGAAPTLTPVTLELGGKSPVVVAADADLDVVARRLAWVKLMNSGQTCIAPDYVLVEDSVKDALVEKVVGAIADTNADQAPMKRIVNQRQYDRLVGYLQATKGKIAVGGAHDPQMFGIEPSVVVDPSPDEPLMREEIFGPILPIVGVDSVDAAIAHVNAGDKPLGLYVFSRSRATARRVVDAVPAGGAVVNHIALHFLVPSLPFGGVGASGMGTCHGEYGFRTFSHGKSVLTKTTRPDLRFVYPPYTETTKRLMRRIF